MQLRQPRSLDRDHYERHFSTLREEFDRNGCVMVQSFLTLAEVESLRTNVDRVVEAVLLGGHKEAVVKIGDQLRSVENLLVDTYFRELAGAPKFLGLGDALLGKRVVATMPEEPEGQFGSQGYIDMPPGMGLVTPPHQDLRYQNFVPTEALGVWVALGETSLDNGGMRYVRGSHRRGLRRHEIDKQQTGFSMKVADFGASDMSEEVSFVMRPGDAVAHHGLTIHRSNGNHSTRNRPAFRMFMRWEGCTRDEEAHGWYQRSLEAHRAARGDRERP
ncbi:MAG: phytanoyl-CoA dioxygenase family protein [Kofleriaceae bacterium]